MDTKHRVRAVQARPSRLVAVATTAAIVASGLYVSGNASAQRAAPAGQQQAPNNLSAAQIRMIQHSLIQGGYVISAADGVWGPQTAASLREFQQVRGLPPTGQPDQQTLVALGVAPANGAVLPAARGATGAAATAPRVQARTPADLDDATIRAIQQALDRHGLQVGPVDGVWGERTASAIGNFQRARGLPASGEPDAHTLAALGLLPGGDARLEPGRVPGPEALDAAAIRLIQQALNQRGFQVGPVDGIWGERTANALRDFQRTQGFEPIGEPDVHSLAALGILPGGSGATTPTAGR